MVAFIISFLFIFLVLENIFSPYIPFINYFDEILTIWAILICIFHKKRTKISTSDNYIIGSIGIVVLIGIFSTAIHHIQPDFGGIWRDCLAIIKFPLCYYVYYNYTSDYTKKLALKKATKFSRFLLSVILLFGFISLATRLPLLNNGFRYGLPLYTFFYTHNTFLIAAVVVMMSVLSANGINKNKKYIVFGIIILLLTLRSKAMPIAFIMILVLIIRKKEVFNIGRFKLLIISILGTFLALYVSADRIDDYFEYADTSARGAFYINGILIANKYFPLGSGFCTFASTLSGEYYSPLYFEYGMQNIWGISVDDTSYAGDTFWPNIYAQYGYIGLIFYIIMFINLIKSANNRFIFFSDKWISLMLLLLYSLSASTAESFFTNDSGVIFAMVMSIYLGGADKRIQQSKL